MKLSKTLIVRLLKLVREKLEPIVNDSSNPLDDFVLVLLDIAIAALEDGE